MKFNVKTKKGILGITETKLQLKDGRFLCSFNATFDEVKLYLKMIYNHVSNFWEDAYDQLSLMEHIIIDKDRTLLSETNVTPEDITFIKKCGGEIKKRCTEDGDEISYTYKGHSIEKFQSALYAEAGAKYEMKCFDDSGVLYEILTFYLSDITRYQKICDEDGIDVIRKSHTLETKMSSETYDKILSEGYLAEYDKRFGVITIKNNGNQYPIIKYKENFYKCMTEIITSHTLSCDGRTLSQKIIKVFEPILCDNNSQGTEINELVQPTLGEYIASIKKSIEAFSSLKEIEPVYTKDEKLVANRYGETFDFKMINKRTNKTYALKVFTKNIKTLTEKYKAIESYFTENYNEETIAIPKVLDNELSINTEMGVTKIPIVISDWVSGINMLTYVRTYAEDKVRMNMLVYKMSLVFRQIKKWNFAHGNINPRNIYIDNLTDVIHIYDYDNMILPEQAGRIKQGDPNYTFPGDVPYNMENADDFSSVTILLSIKAIAINPALYKKNKDNTSLVFQSKDFTNIARSSLTNELSTLLEDSDFRKLYSCFIAVLDKGYLPEQLKNNVIMNNPYEKEAQLMVKEGESLMELCKFVESAEKFKEASLMGNVIANRKLAYMIMHSLIPVNSKFRIAMVLSYYKKNLIYEDHISAFNLGVIYSWYNNYSEAVRFFEVSAHLGNAIAKCNLSYAYEHGIGVKKDPRLADLYFLDASESRNGIVCDIVNNAVFGLQPYTEIIETYDETYYD